ncbi:GspH/FimT family pseudopilin [Thioalkalivibrio sp. ALJ7]|uniref:GspH/FimT family pseudopilin n=1 Tax=Thioalkalivibrio sp. ALJ7 TaxID=1158756 RepID=UPI00036641A5|nr:GspH/FimT family pseudopilin [Thioalkalivibrio sp. ALJ7]
MTRPHGFTLVELMVTIAVAAILITIAVPGFQALVQNNRATALANQLTTAINLARSEAIRRGEVASVCTNDWEDGWWVEPSAGCNAAAADRLRVWDAPPARSVINAGGETSVSFGPMGTRADQNAITLNVHVENCTGDRARILRISPGGRVGVERTACP